METAITVAGGSKKDTEEKMSLDKITVV